VPKYKNTLTNLLYTQLIFKI